jgi:hypothetical protein
MSAQDICAFIVDCYFLTVMKYLTTMHANIIALQQPCACFTGYILTKFHALTLFQHQGVGSYALYDEQTD